MDFRAVIYNGMSNSNNRNNLKSYFIREFKKAERDNFYTVDDFFIPLQKHIAACKQVLIQAIEKRKKELEDYWIPKAKNNEIDVAPEYYQGVLDKQGIIYEEYHQKRNKEFLENGTKQLARLQIDTRTSLDNFNLADIDNLEQSVSQSYAEIGNNLELGYVGTLNEKIKADKETCEEKEDSLSLINEDRRETFLEYESRVSDMVRNWKQQLDKTGCALFCRVLHELNYFSPNTLKTAKKFSIRRYDCDCAAMIDKLGKRENLEKTKKKLDLMKRIIYNKRYGTI